MPTKYVRPEHTYYFGREADRKAAKAERDAAEAEKRAHKARLSQASRALKHPGMVRLAENQKSIAFKMAMAILALFPEVTPVEGGASRTQLAVETAIDKLGADPGHAAVERGINTARAALRGAYQQRAKA